MWLLDTGPIVAYLNFRDPAHQIVGECLDPFSGQLITTGPVITEAMHFLSATRQGPNALANFIATANVEVRESNDPGDIRAAVDLMAKYSDTPMDYADATLVRLAANLGITEILTLDRRGFRTFRAHRNQPFVLVLDEE